MAYWQIETIIENLNYSEKWQMQINEFLKGKDPKTTEIKINSIVGDKLVAVIIYQDFNPQLDIMDARMKQRLHDRAQKIKIYDRAEQFKGMGSVK